jgi:hypothetical protein
MNVVGKGRAARYQFDALHLADVLADNGAR